MKYVKQMAIIGGISFIGEVLHLLLPLPVPASVYGLIILLTCLFCRVIKLEQVEESAEFLITIMPVMFISPTVSIMAMIGGVKDSILGIFVTAFVSTIIVMVITGWVAQIVIRVRRGKENQTNE